MYIHALMDKFDIFTATHPMWFDVPAMLTAMLLVWLHGYNKGKDHIVDEISRSELRSDLKSIARLVN